MHEVKEENYKYVFYLKQKKMFVNQIRMYINSRAYSYTVTLTSLEFASWGGNSSA